MLFADLDQVMSRIDKLEAAIKKPTPKRDEQLREMELMVRLRESLEAEKPLSEAVKTDAEAKLVRSFAFLSQKPALVVLNSSEQELSKEGPAEMHSLPCMCLSAKIEEEVAQIPPQERGEFLADLGLKEIAADRMVRACYRQVKLISFLTAGEPEVRAWTIPAGTDAVNAAGTIHSDIARGFIRAETVAYEDLHACGDMKAAKAAGKVRLEGKNYIVQDGDVMYFRFNV
jgi:ribosome-binding ATPase YchF (GTP1/OBG family)